VRFTTGRSRMQYIQRLAGT